MTAEAREKLLAALQSREGSGKLGLQRGDEVAQFSWEGVGDGGDVGILQLVNESTGQAKISRQGGGARVGRGGDASNAGGLHGGGEAQTTKPQR